MMFLKGETLYTHTGTPVEYDHVHDGIAYVRPILTVIHQVSNSRGDDFHEEEDEIAAGHLITVALDKLTRSKPVAVLDAEIAERLAKLESIKKTITLTERECKAAMAACERQLSAKQKELDDYRLKYPLFEETMRFLEGNPMFPLSVGEDSYHHAPAIPRIPTPEAVRYIRMRQKRRAHPSVRKAGAEADKLEWVAVTKSSYGDAREDLQLFFATEEERAAHIASMFAKVCTAFRARPNYNVMSYSSDLDYGTLLRWIKEYPALVIPDDLVSGKAADDATKAEARREALRKQLEAMEGQ